MCFFVQLKKKNPAVIFIAVKFPYGNQELITQQQFSVLCHIVIIANSDVADLLMMIFTIGHLTFTQTYSYAQELLGEK